MKFINDEVTSIGRKGIYKIDTGAWRKERPVMDEATCIKCGRCYMYCPVFSIEEKEDGFFNINYDYCKGCGICAYECPVDSIEMKPEEE